MASRVKHVYDVANRDVEAWLKAVMSPLETQVREHHLQLRRRLESIKRIHHASGELEERIVELEQQEAAIALQIKELMQEVSSVDAIVMYPDTLCRWLPTPEIPGAARRRPAIRGPFFVGAALIPSAGHAASYGSLTPRPRTAYS